MVQWVFEQTRKAESVSEVIVATDDDRILKAVNGFGGNAVMTSVNHDSGTDRIAEVVRDLHRTDDQREQSYSERQLYEAALERLTREIAVVNGAEESTAGQEITDVLMSRVVPAAS